MASQTALAMARLWSVPSSPRPLHPTLLHSLSLRSIAGLHGRQGHPARRNLVVVQVRVAHLTGLPIHDPLFRQGVPEPMVIPPKTWHSKSLLLSPAAIVGRDQPHEP